MEKYWKLYNSFLRLELEHLVILSVPINAAQWEFSYQFRTMSRKSGKLDLSILFLKECFSKVVLFFLHYKKCPIGNGLSIYLGLKAI